jgi:hypothetical protein
MWEAGRSCCSDVFHSFFAKWLRAGSRGRQVMENVLMARSAYIKALRRTNGLGLVT